MQKEHVSLRISMELLAHIDAQSELSSLTRSEVINKILEKYFLKKDISFEFHGFDSNANLKALENKEIRSLSEINLSSKEKKSLETFETNTSPIFIMSLFENPVRIIWSNKSCNLFFKDTEYSLEELASSSTLKPLFFNKLTSNNYSIQECELFSSDGFPFNCNIVSFPLFGYENLKICIIDRNFERRKDKFENAKFWFTQLTNDLMIPCLIIQNEKCIWGNIESESFLGYNLHELKQKTLKDFFTDTKLSDEFTTLISAHNDFNILEKRVKWISKSGEILNIRLVIMPGKNLGNNYVVMFARRLPET